MTHLTSKQIHEWAIGERNTEAARHLEVCRTCREEITILQHGLQAFRHSVHRLASTEMTAATVKSPTPQFSWKWATTIAVSIGLALLPIYLDRSKARQDEQTAQDSLLLNQINARLSRTVPEPMEPLMILMNDAKGDSQ